VLGTDVRGDQRLGLLVGGEQGPFGIRGERGGDIRAATLVRADLLFLIANGFFLLLVTMMPLPTTLVTAYLNTPADSVATAVYAGTLFMVTVFHNLLWLSATYNRRLFKPSTPEFFVSVQTRNSTCSGCRCT
jgi:uncharacterized membrane protein